LGLSNANLEVVVAGCAVIATEAVGYGEVLWGQNVQVTSFWLVTPPLGRH
jgi:hypothetical protein